MDFHLQKVLPNKEGENNICSKQLFLYPSVQTSRFFLFVLPYNRNLQICLCMHVISKLLMVQALKYSKAEGT